MVKEMKIKICLISIIVTVFFLLIPLSTALQPTTKENDGMVILVNPWAFEKNGKMQFNITSIYNEDLYNLTFIVRLYGAGPFSWKFNKIDTTTDIHVDCLQTNKPIIVETEDKLFNTLPIINRMFCPFFTGRMTMTFHTYSEEILIQKIYNMGKVSDYFYFPYP